MLAYLKTSLCVATPPVYSRPAPHHSPSGRPSIQPHHIDDSSPSGRTNHQWSQQSPQHSPSGRTTPPGGTRHLSRRASTDD
ncbi:unnamed protein product, partial [Ectocarpus sp. 8 AP-2014]